MVTDRRTLPPLYAITSCALCEECTTSRWRIYNLVPCERTILKIWFSNLPRLTFSHGLSSIGANVTMYQNYVCTINLKPSWFNKIKINSNNGCDNVFWFWGSAKSQRNIDNLYSHTTVCRRKRYFLVSSLQDYSRNYSSVLAHII